MLELVAAEVPTTRDHLEHELLRIRGEIEIRELYFSRLAAALSAMNLAEDNESEMTTIDWLRFNCRLTQNVASDRVAIGEKLAAKPLGKFDYRERPQRLADALVELATAGGKVAVQMQVTSSIETLLGLLGAPGAETEFSLPVSSKTVER